MGLKKGQTNNLNGRKKGIPNKLTADLRIRINDFLNYNFETMIKDFENLESKDKFNFYIKLLDYALPKLQSIEVTNPLETNFIIGDPFAQIRKNAGIEVEPLTIKIVKE